MNEGSMTNQVSNMMQETPVVPLVQAEDPATAVEISRALAKGGLKVAEVLFRTDAALECVKEFDQPACVICALEMLKSLRC